ncbi:TetR/AcrR family transcriptional regulator C-terminal domain-containing protein [Streptomyces sp. NPDC044571]|uniref:TetR/AcrR family transcriptional regulator C-terminal domain-containing protein n=1 Tax=Streptomyces sp. NPDC044571 TaxID=3155371 RepID=UPI0033E18B27
MQAFGSYLSYGPGKARHDDHSLAIYEVAGFEGRDAERAAAAVFTFVLGSALGSSATASLVRRLRREGGDPEELIQDTLAKAGEDAMKYPRLRTRLDTLSADHNASPERTFEYALQALLDGLEGGRADGFDRGRGGL